MFVKINSQYFIISSINKTLKLDKEHLESGITWGKDEFLSKTQEAQGKNNNVNNPICKSFSIAGHGCSHLVMNNFYFQLP